MCRCKEYIKVNSCKQLFGECMVFFTGKKGSSKPGHPLSGGSVFKHAGTKGSEFGCLII